MRVFGVQQAIDLGQLRADKTFRLPGNFPVSSLGPEAPNARVVKELPAGYQALHPQAQDEESESSILVVAKGGCAVPTTSLGRECGSSCWCFRGIPRNSFKKQVQAEILEFHLTSMCSARFEKLTSIEFHEPSSKTTNP